MFSKWFEALSVTEQWSSFKNNQCEIEFNIPMIFGLSLKCFLLILKCTLIIVLNCWGIESSGKILAILLGGIANITSSLLLILIVWFLK